MQAVGAHLNNNSAPRKKGTANNLTEYLAMQGPVVSINTRNHKAMQQAVDPPSFLVAQQCDEILPKMLGGDLSVIQGPTQLS